MQLTQERYGKFVKVLKSLSERISIIITLADPDAIGAAAVFRNLARYLIGEKAVAVNIYLCGSFGNQQNKNILEKLEIENAFRPVTDFLQSEMKDFTVLLDSSSLNDSRLPEKLKSLKPSIIIDHHKTDLIEEENQFFWTDDVGSTCTMIAEIADLAKYNFSDRAYDAMLLTIGMHNDTNRLENYCPRTMARMGELSKFVKAEMMPKLLKTPKNPKYLEQMTLALNNLVFKGDRLVTNIGFVEGSSSEGNRALIADELCDITEHATVIVWEVRRIEGNRFRWDLSARGKQYSVIPLHTFMREKFRGGAQKSGHKGGAQIDFDIGVLGSYLDKMPETRKAIIKMLQTAAEELTFTNDL